LRTLYFWAENFFEFWHDWSSKVSSKISSVSSSMAYLTYFLCHKLLVLGITLTWAWYPSSTARTGFFKFCYKFEDMFSCFWEVNSSRFSASTSESSPICLTALYFLTLYPWCLLLWSESFPLYLNRSGHPFTPQT
jgi:hypothetical protein